MQHETEIKTTAMKGILRQLTVLMMGIALLLFSISCTQKQWGPQATEGTDQAFGKGMEKLASSKSMTRHELASEFGFDPDILEPGEVCVINDNEVEAEKVDQFARIRGYTKKKRRILESLGFVMSILKVPEGSTVRQGLTELRQAFPSQIIDANHRYSLQSVISAEDTKRYGFQMVGWNEQAFSCGVENQRIGIVDTTVNLSHPLLKGQSIKTRTFLPKNSLHASEQHGTAVATLLIGQSLSNEGSLLPKGQLFVAETFRELQPGQVEATTWSIVRALDWLVEEQVDVINLSLGGPPNALLSYAIDQTLSRNIPIVAAAGNTGPRGQPIYPAAQKGVIAVTALDANLHPYNFASRGSFISFSAPGVDIWVPNGEKTGVFKSGTSFAAPFVTTAAAALKLSHPQWTPQEVARHLAHDAVDLGSKGKDEIFGWGLIQIPKTCANQSFLMTTKTYMPTTS